MTVSKKNKLTAIAEEHIPKGSWLKLIHLLNGFMWVLVFQFIGIVSLITFWIQKEQNNSFVIFIALGILILFNVVVFLNLLLFLFGFPKILLEKLRGHSRDELKANENTYAQSGKRYKYSINEWSQLVISTIITLAISFLFLAILSSLVEKSSQIENVLQTPIIYIRLIIFLWIASTLIVKFTLIWRGLLTLKKSL